MSGTSEDLLTWLQAWYQKHTNGVWEHQYGVQIDTLDNPGWTVKVDLIGTELASKKFSFFKEDRGRNDWIVCQVENGKFEGAGDTTKLRKILEAFKDWASGP